MNIPKEFKYLLELLEFRLSNKSSNDIPEMPSADSWELPLNKFISENELESEEAVLILLALVPYFAPELFDTAFQNILKTSGDFPEIGGVRGKNFRGFIPTGQTAVFLLAGDDWQKRLNIELMFSSERKFAKRKILWLEELPFGEPPLSGRILISREYYDMFIFGKPSEPHFSVNFPAKKLNTGLEWDDLVISDDLRDQINEIDVWVRNNDELMNKWEMKNRVKNGYRALFYGPPGTGKTLTASLLGKYAFEENNSGKKVYKVDLSLIVSKYIGETEKNLEMLFARAEDKGWILFFDEADALFGKRTNVRDAHDKYANQEVSYLLQRIEEYNGLVILATNMKNNIDDAFIRRFNSILKFSLPDQNERSRIWWKSFPKRSAFLRTCSALNSNGEITRVNNERFDLPEAVKKYELSGGSIINAVQYSSLKAIERRNAHEKVISSNSNFYNKIQLNGFENTKSYGIGSFNNVYRDHNTSAGGKTEIATEGLDCSKDQLIIYLDDVLEGIKREMIKEGKPFIQ